MNTASIIMSAAILLLLFVVVVGKGERNEYVRYQQVYRHNLRASASAGALVDYPIKVRQLVLDERGTIDRCVTCHVGMEDQRMADAPQPLRSHPGNILRDHSVDRFGCVSCHGGQGRAITRKDAHRGMIR